jgi:hypothetical protein
MNEAAEPLRGVPSRRLGTRDRSPSPLVFATEFEGLAKAIEAIQQRIVVGVGIVSFDLKLSI